MKTARRQFEPSTAAGQRRRCGALLMELVAATALFGMILAIAVPVIASVTAIREEAQQRQLAQIELANVMERIAAGRRAHGSLETAVGEVQVSPDLTAVVPEAALAIDVVPAGDLPHNMRVTARLTWTGASGQPAAPVELTAFFVESAAQEAAP